MSFPKITIITPSYNQAAYLEQTIQSVLGQGYPNLEYIIIDGGSTDASVDIIEKYASQLTYWVSEKDKGTYDAINKALKIFTGDYWCVVNSDDTLHPGSLETIATYIQQHGPTDWLTGGIQFIDENAEKIGRSIPDFPEKVSGLYFLNMCWIYHPVTFLSRNLYQQVGEFNKMDIMDYDYWIRAEKKGFLPTVIRQELGSLRYHDDCKSMDFLKIYQSNINLLNAHGSEVTDQQQLRAHLSSLNLALLQSKTKVMLFRKKRGKAASLLAYTLFKYPAELFKRWPYGLMKRFFSGIQESEFSPREFLRQMN